MSEFINTADVIGDAEMCDQIIMRTVTEYKENRITQVGRRALCDCTKLKTVELPNVTELVGDKASGGHFSGCSALEELNMPLIKKVQGAWAFSGTTRLKTVNFPELEQLEDYAFREGGLTGRVVLPKLTRIGNGTFMNCPIEILDLSAVTYINGPFEYCTSLVALIIRTPTVCTWGTNWGLPPTIMSTGTGYIYVPRALVDSYKAATNWSTYAAQIRAIEDYPEITGG